MDYRRLFLIGLLCLMANEASASDAALLARGRHLVEANCAACHSIETQGASSHPEAPPFRSLSDRYPVSDLQEALVEGIMTGHPDMPQFIATSEQASAIIAYIESLDR
ncbi:cytochrome c [Aureimonas sp. SA4125]|uniref:c-type cytochrome n=1 Tax=Aureimonas sp. SA4125 TaxID=2826993 RepID=UPI001CC57688|nr:cytochrome c [Aureimonas sp. SA4125]